MELRLIIFLGLVSVVLGWNAALLWLIYRELRSLEDRIGSFGSDGRRLLAGFAEGVRRLEAASFDAVSWSGAVVERSRDLERNLAEALSRYRYRLAQLDFKVDQVSGYVGQQADAVESAIRKPLTRTATFLGAAEILVKTIARLSRPERSAKH